MAKSLNKWMGIGNVGADPEIRVTPGGSMVANFNIACADDYKDKSGKKVEQTEWIRVVAFGKLAEIIEKYVKKGSKIYIEGKFVTRKWQDKDGNDRYSTEIQAREMQMLDSSHISGEGGYTKPTPVQSASDDFNDPIPF